jgi:hypothetical protein
MSPLASVGSPLLDERVASDPYFAWAGLDYDARLPRETVQACLAKWLEAQLLWIWDQQTEIKLPWYLNRIDGLIAWCLDEAALRLSSFSAQDSFTAAEFKAFHFTEALRKKKRGAQRSVLGRPRPS